MILWRPVGMRELEHIFDARMLAFPPRLPAQPIFYPVLNESYAVKIARDWNTQEEPFAGYVTRFELPDSYAAQFEAHQVGGRQHQELWVSNRRLKEFNAQLCGPIEVEAAFFGPRFLGYVPEHFLLAGKQAGGQFQSLARIMDYSGMDFVLETGANELAVFLNFPFWLASTPAQLSVEPVVYAEVIRQIRLAWEFAPRRANLVEQGERVG